MKSPVILAAVACFISAVSVKAQDALRSALALQPVIGPAQTAALELPANKPHIGPVQFDLGTYVGSEFNDNVNSSEFNPQADLLFRAGLSLGLAWPVTSESDLRLSSNFGYVHYLRNSQYDHLEVAPNSALAWSIGFPNGTVTLFDQVSYSQQVLAESAISGLATFPLVNNAVGAQLNWQPDKWVMNVGYTHNNTFSDSSQFQYLNSSSEFVFARAGWRLGELSHAGLEATAGSTRYELGTQNDNQSLSFGPYTDWQITQWLHASIRGGAVVYAFASQPLATQGKTLDDYYVGFEVEHRLTDFFTHKIDVQRDVRQGLNQGSSYVQELSARYSVSYALTSRIDLGAGFTYEQGRQPLEIPVEVFPFGTFIVLATENYSRYGGNFSTTWRATDKFSLSLTYSYWLRASDINGLGYRVNSLALNFSYTF